MKPQPMITVRSVPDSAKWYQQVLGFESAHGGDEYEQLVSGGRLVLQLHNLEPDMNHDALLKPGDVPGQGVLLWFKTKDFEGALERIQQAGVIPEVAPYLNEYAQHMEVWLRDPDGYRVVVAGPSKYDHKPWEET